MNKVKYYHVTETGLVEGTSLGRLAVVLSADFDRLTAEREALQQRLTTADQMNDEMIALLRRIGGANYQDQQKAIGEAHELFHGANRNAPDSAATEACQFPQSCTTRCDCDIPDFSPGNGNKARRRAEAIEALKPENQRITPITPVDPFTTCLDCFGSGTTSTGITEAPSTICNGCDGTGREKP